MDIDSVLTEIERLHRVMGMLQGANSEVARREASAAALDAARAALKRADRQGVEAMHATLKEALEQAKRQVEMAGQR